VSGSVRPSLAAAMEERQALVGPMSEEGMGGGQFKHALAEPGPRRETVAIGALIAIGDELEQPRCNLHGAGEGEIQGESALNIARRP
jgi:hypothetical protein